MATPTHHIELVDDGLPATRPDIPDDPRTSWRDQVAATLDAAELLSRGQASETSEPPPASEA
jgi:hypothetical protein